MRRIPFQSIELLPDADAAARVREDWRRLQAAGLSSLGARPDGGNAPHLTLVAAPRLPHPPPTLWTVLPVAAELGAPELLGEGERRALVRAVLPSAALTRLHERLHEGVADADPRTLPGDWRPHLTLARRLRVEQLPQALEALAAGPAQLRFVSARHWDPATRTISDL